MAKASYARITCIGVDVQSTHAEKPSVLERAQQDLAASRKTVGARGPIFQQPPNEAESLSLTGLDQKLHEREHGAVELLDREHRGRYSMA
jgi:hypothetical protein